MTPTGNFKDQKLRFVTEPELPIEPVLESYNLRRSYTINYPPVAKVLLLSLIKLRSTRYT